MKTIEFEEQNHAMWLCVVDWPDIAAGKIQLLKPDESVTSRQDIEVRFDYPLDRPATFAFHNDGGFTRSDLFRVIYEGYKRIYDAEEDPGQVSGMCLNRRWTIWCLIALLDCAVQDSPGRFSLGISS